MNHVLQGVAVLMVVRLAGELFLAILNCREVRRNRPSPPAPLLAIMDVPTFQKAADYTLARQKFQMVETVFGTLVLALVVFGAILPTLFAKIAAWSPGAAKWDDALFVLVSAVLVGIPGLPFEWWSQFRLEARFGFNKSTPGLWVLDRIKALLLTFAIGFPLLWGLLSLVGVVGRFWWIWGFGLFFTFQLLMLVLYPKLILPLFNKLTPLTDDSLRNRLMALADRTGFKAKAIEVMDGSKRSGHSNAFFTGFGRFRRIVLFDTLIAQLTPEELEAVLAHEVGHYRRGHIPKMLLVSAVLQFIGFALIAWLAQSSWFNPAFGFPEGELAPAFLLFGLLSGLVTFWFSPISNLFSRKHEFEADRFAREAMNGPTAMVSALHKLAQKNLSNLTPHPWYSGFHYSHPTMVERERALLAS